MTIPPYLRRGDTIALVCPAGFMEPGKWQDCVETLGSWGYNVKLGSTLQSRSDNYFSGTPLERLVDLQLKLDDPSIQAILCARGGYGVSQIIDQINFKSFKKHPKWLIGFSDITLLHAHLNRKLGIASLHAPMAGAFNGSRPDNPYLLSLYKAISGKKANYRSGAHADNIYGESEGPVIGGNLSLIAHSIGTPSAYKTRGRILFLEEIGEQLYNTDRMLWQLKRAGIFEKLGGLILGGFTDNKDTERPYGKTIQQILTGHFSQADYPVCYNFPIGHQQENYAIKIGLTYRLSINDDGVKLREL